MNLFESMVLKASHLENLVLLEHLTRDVQGQILTVNNTLDKVQVIGNKLLTVVHDEHTAHIQLNVVSLLLGVKHIKLREVKTAIKP
jgi:hypothetical protein